MVVTGGDLGDKREPRSDRRKPGGNMRRYGEVVDLKGEVDYLVVI